MVDEMLEEISDPEAKSASKQPVREDGHQQRENCLFALQENILR